MGELATYGIRAVANAAIDWDSGRRLIDELGPGPSTSGTGAWTTTTTAARWRQEVAEMSAFRPRGHRDDEATRRRLRLLPDAKVDKLEAPLTERQFEAVKDILRADLARLEELFELGDPGRVVDGVNCWGHFDAIGEVRILRVTVDLWLFESSVDGWYPTMARLRDFGILASVPGIEEIHEI